jgi:hypothetical protein
MLLLVSDPLCPTLWLRFRLELTALGILYNDTDQVRTPAHPCAYILLTRAVRLLPAWPRARRLDEEPRRHRVHR